MNVSELPPWERYVEGVISGVIPACKFIQLACKRHRDDKERSRTSDWPYIFIDKKAERLIAFFSHLQLTKGLPHPGKLFAPELWQAFLVAMIFGWVHKKTDLRRFRRGHIMVPRKNGKSPTLAAIGLYGLIKDNEMGAEIYSAATKKDQAKIIWDFAVDFRRHSRGLATAVSKSVSALYVTKTGSKFQALSSDEEGLDGLNVHIGLIDEYQNHKTDVVYERISTARSARRQPLILTIATAGMSRESPCWREHEYAANILKGDFHDDSYFAFLAEADEEDVKEHRWDQPEVWRKCNPNLGVSKSIDYMIEECAAAKNEPAKLNSFLRLDLNIWTQQEYAWMPMDKWRLCFHKLTMSDPKTGELVIVDHANFDQVIEAMLAEWRLPYAGLDLSEKIDLTALVLLFPPSESDPRWVALPRFWVPQENVAKRAKNDRVPYDVWIREKWIQPTPGNVVDYDVIREDILRIQDQAHIQGLAVDPHNALQLNNQLLGHGVPVVEVQQGWKSLSDPTKQLMAWVLAGKFNHLNSPVMNWMAGNIAIHQDSAGNIRPDKAKSRERIDGIAALVNAMYLALSQDMGPYTANRGILTI